MRRGNAPPFSLGLAQRKRPRPVKRKALSRKVGAAGAFLRKTRGRRGRCCADLQTSTGCAIPLGNRDGAPPHLIVRHFFRRWSSNRPASLSAAAPSPREGESKGEGPQPLPFVSFQGGPGGIEAPHVYAGSADAISFGRRLIPPGFTSAQRNGPRLTGRLMPGLFGGRGGTLLFSKEKCPLLPRPGGAPGHTTENPSLCITSASFSDIVRYSWPHRRPRSPAYR